MAISRRVPTMVLVGLGALGVLVGLAASRGLTNDASGGTALESRAYRLPLSFEPNAGRTDPRVDYVAHSVSGGTLYLTGPEARLALGGGTLRLRFAGAAADPRVTGLDRLTGVANSYVGDDPDAWRTGLSTYAGVRYRGLYPGIDVDFHGDQRNLEYDYRLAPGADPSRIALDVSGANSVVLSRSGDLEIAVGDETITQRTPVSYQWIDGERRLVESGYALHGDRVTVELGPYDRSRPLVIDPVLVYSTPFGGSGIDGALGIAADDGGNTFVVGSTDSTDFPTANPVFADQPGTDAFVFKLNPAGNGLLYSSYLGGSSPLDQANGVDLDPGGNAYVVGQTASNDFPLLDALGPDPPSFDAFAAKFTPTGALDYSTLLGGGSVDTGLGIAVGSTGSAWLTGTTTSTDFPTANAFQSARSGSVDAFVARLGAHNGPGPVSLLVGTYFGGGGSGFFEQGSAIAVDSADAAYVGGATDSTTLPVLDALIADQPGLDGWVAKFLPSGALARSTYLGGNGGTNPGERDEVTAIAVDPTGSVFAVGRTDSTDLPLVSPYQTDQPQTDAFLALFNPAGTAFNFLSYFGGELNDWPFGAAFDPVTGNFYVAGITGSDIFPALGDQLSPNASGNDEAFIAKFLAGSNSLDYSTVFGGNGIDFPHGLALDGSGNAYIAGQTGSGDFPVVGARLGPGGSDDGFVAKVEDGALHECGLIAVHKLVKRVGDELTQEEIATHEDQDLVFVVGVITKEFCRVQIEETSDSLQNFDFAGPAIASVDTEYAGNYQAIARFTVRHSRFNGTRKNQVRVELENGEVGFADATVTIYGNESDIKEASGGGVAGSAAASGGDAAGKAVSGDAEIAKVATAVLEVEKGLEPFTGEEPPPVMKAKQCHWLTKKGKFKSVKPTDGVCDEPIWIKAKLGKEKKGKRPWSYEFKHELPPGKYIAYSRSTNGADVTEPEFSKQLGNLKKFKVKD